MRSALFILLLSGAASAHAQAPAESDDMAPEPDEAPIAEPAPAQPSPAQPSPAEQAAEEPAPTSTRAQPAQTTSGAEPAPASRGRASSTTEVTIPAYSRTSRREEEEEEKDEGDHFDFLWIELSGG